MKAKFKTRSYIIGITLVFIAVATACKKDEPDPVEAPVVATEVKDITATSVLCIGKIVSCKNSWDWHHRGICYSNFNPLPAFSGSSIGGTFYDSCSFSMILDRLTPGTKYCLRAYVENSAGTGYGNVIEFSTLGSNTSEVQFNPNLT